MAYIAKHYIGQYTPGEIIRKELSDAARLVRLGAIEPLENPDAPIPEAEDVNDRKEPEGEEKNGIAAEEKPDNAEEADDVAECEAPEMDATDAILQPEEAEPPKRSRNRRAADQ